jgi:antitoxin component HigA of HigAB toxin-antitoxin module
MEILTDKSYRETMVVIYNLMNKGETNLTSEELDDLEIMAIAAEQYEDNKQKAARNANGFSNQNII